MKSQDAKIQENPERSDTLGPRGDEDSKEEKNNIVIINTTKSKRRKRKKSISDLKNLPTSGNRLESENKEIQKKRKYSFQQNKSSSEHLNSEYFNYEKLSFCQLICSKYCSFWTKKTRARRKTLAKAIKKVTNYLDVYKYIMRMQDIDMMKSFLFDGDKKLLFDFASKPSFKMNFNMEEEESAKDVGDSDSNKREYNKKEIEKIYNAYGQIKKKKTLSLGTKKLLKIIDDEVNFFD